MFFRFFPILFLINFLYASPSDESSEKANLEIVVEDTRGFQIYVAPIQYKFTSENLEANIDPNTVFGYASQHWKMAKVYNGRGGYEPITLNTEGFDVYNKETMKYFGGDCNYSRDAKACAVKNDHYLLETYIVIGEDEAAVNMYIYDSSLQVVSHSLSYERKKVTWKELNYSSATSGSSSSVLNCQGQNCLGAQNGVSSSSINSFENISIPQAIEVPPKFLVHHIHQASMGLWLGLRIK